MPSRLRSSASLAITIVLAAALGACSLLPDTEPSPSTTPSSVSVDAACDALEDEAIASSDEMLEGSMLFSTDATGGAEKLENAADRLEKAAATVENDKVGELAREAGDTVGLLSDLVTAYAADPTDGNAEPLSAASADADASFGALAEVCDWTPSVSASCDALEGDAVAVNAELSAASDLLSTDPSLGASTLAEAAARFESAAGAVANDEVSELAVATSDRLNAFSELINALAADPANPDEEALTAGSDDLNEAFNELASFCAW